MVIFHSVNALSNAAKAAMLHAPMLGIRVTAVAELFASMLSGAVLDATAVFTNCPRVLMAILTLIETSAESPGDNCPNSHTTSG